jgi:hypothetical protein
MFETPEFREQIVNALPRIVREAGATVYDDEIIDYLLNLAIDNERRDSRFLRDYTVETVLQLTLASLERLIRQGVVYARQRRYRGVTLGDVEKAYQALFCRVWPFCK